MIREFSELKFFSGDCIDGTRWRIVDGHNDDGGRAKSTPDRELNRTGSRARILTVIGISDGAQGRLVRGCRSAAGECQDAGRSNVTSRDTILVRELQAILGGVEVGGQRNRGASHLRAGKRQAGRNKHWNGALDVRARVVDR